MSKAEDVDRILRDCLFTEEEMAGVAPGVLPEHAVVAPGIVANYGFHGERIKAHAAEIRELLSDLPIEFYPKAQGGGDGWSFLNLCMTRDGVQWGEHPTMEALVCLGHAAGFARWEPADRNLWPVFPGGVPYVLIDLEPTPEATEG